MVKKTWLDWSTNQSGAFSPILASASTNRTAKNNTCSNSFSAKAETADVGMMFIKNSTVWGSSPLLVFFATEPGLTMLPITSPKIRANVVTTSK